MQRPTSVTVLGWLGVLLRALTVTVSAVFLVGLLVDPEGFLTALFNWAEKYTEQTETALKGYKVIAGVIVDPFHRALIGGTSLVTVVIYALLVVGAWKALALRERGRQLILAAAVAILVWDGVQRLVDKAVYEPIRAQTGIQKEERGFAVPLHLAYALAVLYFMTRPSVCSVMRIERKFGQ